MTKGRGDGEVEVEEMRAILARAECTVGDVDPAAALRKAATARARVTLTVMEGVYERVARILGRSVESVRAEFPLASPDQ